MATAKQLPAVQKEGPIVAVQYPATVEFSSSIDTGKELNELYGHLKQLDPEDKKAYSELTKAISDVKSRRTEVTKQENVIKKPLNEFRTLVIDTAKEVRSAIEPIETQLVNEKQRIDDIRAEKLAAQQRLWSVNLMAVNNLGAVTLGMTVLDLERALSEIEDFSLESLDFGDMIEDAKAALANARIRVETAIEQEKAAIKFRAEQEAFKAQQAEQAEKDRIANEAAAAALAENEALKAQLAAMQKPVEEQTRVVDECADKVDATVSFNEGSDSIKSMTDGTSGAAQWDCPAIEYAKPDSHIDHVNPEQDIKDIDAFIELLLKARDEAPLLKDANLNAAVNRVVKNIGNAVSYLVSVKHGGEV